VFCLARIVAVVVVAGVVADGVVAASGDCRAL